MQQMATRIHNGNAHGPVVFFGFGLRGSGNGLNV
jgi:hypothetical protein